MTCRECGRTFISDNTPMARSGVCLFCRPAVEVTCSRCQQPCPGAYDGLTRCPACRDTPLGQQRYEDRQRTRYEQLVRRGIILPDGTSIIPLAELEALVANLG